VKPDDLRPDKILRGPLFPEPVQVIVTMPIWAGVELIGKGLQTGKVVDISLNELINRQQVRLGELSEMHERSLSADRQATTSQPLAANIKQTYPQFTSYFKRASEVVVNPWVTTLPSMP
jgi:hypothetical protein